MVRAHVLVRITTFVLALALVATTANGQQAPPITLEGTEHHEFVTAEGVAYKLYVGLPPDYESDSDVTYPVLYVLDGEYMFLLVRSVYEMFHTGPLSFGVPAVELEQGGFVGTPLIIVGIDRAGSHSGRASA